MARRVLLLICLALSFALAWLVLTGPKPKPSGAPPQVFSAGRAMADVSMIAMRQHPVGSPEDAAVRDYLLQRMTALGLSPRVQSTVQISDKTRETVTVNTLVGVLPGRGPTAPAMAVMAHYDSTVNGPGAGDDAAGVAAVLETARALKADGVPGRDVAFIITDGEEAGMLGAKAFFAGDPLAKRLDFVVNLEARGSRGRAMMFETGRGNGQTIALLKHAAKRPLSNSLMVMVYDLMPNFSDFTLAKDAGLQGLNFAFLGGPKDYHAATDTPANLDQRSLQDIGDQTLAAARGAAAGAMAGPTANLVYGDVLGLGILSYPPWVGWVILAASLALLAAGAVQSGVKGPEVGVGLAFSAGLLVIGGLIFYGAQVVVHALKLTPEDQTLAIEAAGWALALAVFAAWAVLARNHRAGQWMGALLFGLILATAAQAFAAPAAPVLAWPLAIACFSAAVTALGARFATAAALLAVPALAVVVCLVHLAFLSLLTPAVIAAWPWLAALLLAPLARRYGYKST